MTDTHSHCRCKACQDAITRAAQQAEQASIDAHLGAVSSRLAAKILAARAAIAALASEFDDLNDACGYAPYADANFNSAMRVTKSAMSAVDACESLLTATLAGVEAKVTLVA